MTSKITIPKFYQDSYKYLYKLKMQPSKVLAFGGLNAVYERAREMGYINRHADEREENPFN
jgi:hypothetical protein